MVQNLRKTARTSAHACSPGPPSTSGGEEGPLDTEPKRNEMSRRIGSRWAERVVHAAAFALDLCDEIVAFLQLYVDEVHGLLQNDALTPTLALQTRHQLCEAIKAFANGCTSFLLRGNMIALFFLIGKTRLVLVLGRSLLGCPIRR